VGLRSKEDLKKLNMIDIIKSLFSWKQIDYLNKNAPEFIQAPTGTKININYSEEQPKIKIRIQELFGLKIHPTIGEDMRGRYPRNHWPENPMNSEPTKRAKKQK
jgi:ATP-dependent helicase HrpB